MPLPFRIPIGIRLKGRAFTLRTGPRKKSLSVFSFRRAFLSGASERF